jgi:hypothetical protein
VDDAADEEDGEGGATTMALELLALGVLAMVRGVRAMAGLERVVGVVDGRRPTTQKVHESTFEAWLPPHRSFMVPARPGPPGLVGEHILRPMSAAAFQAAQTTGFRHFAIGTRWDPTPDTETTDAPVSSLPVPLSAQTPAKRARMGPQPSRQRYTSKDFAVPFESAETVERWYREHPAVR